MSPRPAPVPLGRLTVHERRNAYLNIPHRIQKFVPEIWLPEPNGTDTFKISHPVDDGDIAFVMRLARNSIFCTPRPPRCRPPRCRG